MSFDKSIVSQTVCLGLRQLLNAALQSRNICHTKIRVNFGSPSASLSLNLTDMNLLMSSEESFMVCYRLRIKYISYHWYSISALSLDRNCNIFAVMRTKVLAYLTLALIDWSLPTYTFYTLISIYFLRINS